MAGYRSTMAGALCAALTASSPAWAQGSPLPWGQPSDMVAWEVFMQIAAPSGVPGSRNVAFETWASDQDIYVPAGQTPQWPPVGAPKKLQPSLLAAAIQSGEPGPHVITPDLCVAPRKPAWGDFPANACIGEEVRRNWASFQYIVTNNLYTNAGLVAAFNNGLKVDLGADAVEVKGDWVKIDDLVSWINTALKPDPKMTRERVRELYHTNTASDGTTTYEYALVGLAMSSKQIKDWVWATFEHQMSPGRCDDIGCHDSYGAEVPDLAPMTPANQYYGECRKTPALQAMFANAGLSPVWQNYCLKGSQITFTTAGGDPTRLGNSVVERINAGVPLYRSSCITCHVYAAFDKTGQPNGSVLSNPPIGPVDPAKLEGQRQNDFLWGLLNIQQ